MRVGRPSQEAVGGQGARGGEEGAQQHSQPVVHAERHARRAVARFLALVEAHVPRLERHARRRALAISILSGALENFH